MDNSVLNSTFLLTLLLLVGLFFFIRASIKDRIEVSQIRSDQPQESVLDQLQQYFTDRAYRVAAVDASQQTIRWEGQVRPSWFLAIFLSGLAAVGSSCLALVLGMLFPPAATFVWGLLLIAPLAGLFYWRGAGRAESVSLQVNASVPAAAPNESLTSVMTVTAHRDELAALKRSLPFEFAEQEG